MDDGQVANTLVVQSKVLGERLRTKQLKASLHEIADSKSIVNRITARKPLVGRVKEREKLLLFDDVGELNPLLLGRIAACWVVGASMEDDNGSLGGVLQISTETFEVDGSGVWIPVAVVVAFGEPGTEKDFLVILPCWILK